MWAGEVREDSAAAFGPVSGFKETADQRGNLHKNLKKKKKKHTAAQHTHTISCPETLLSSLFTG